MILIFPVLQIKKKITHQLDNFKSLHNSIDNLTFRLSFITTAVVLGLPSITFRVTWSMEMNIRCFRNCIWVWMEKITAYLFLSEAHSQKYLPLIYDTNLPFFSLSTYQFESLKYVGI